jgi:hypothetical protein
VQDLGLLFPDGAFSSNPCSTVCWLNPVYDFLPRGQWVVDSGVCQRLEDFVLDPTSGTLCCPSPDYCCPNSVANCSRPEAVLFDVSTANAGGPVPLEQIADSWRTHFYSRKSSRGPELLCPPSSWNGNAEQPPCFWAMTEPSVRTVERVWQHAPPLDVSHLIDDDDTHHWARQHR